MHYQGVYLHHLVFYRGLKVRGPPESPIQVEEPATSAHCCRSVIVADGQTFLQSESLIHWVVIH